MPAWPEGAWISSEVRPSQEGLTRTKRPAFKKKFENAAPRVEVKNPAVRPARRNEGDGWLSTRYPPRGGYFVSFCGRVGRAPFNLLGVGLPARSRHGPDQIYACPDVYRERIDFSKINTTIPIPNLIEIQKKSYERFLQMNRLPPEREDVGLQSVFKSVFPISDFRENSSLEFIDYSIGNWECKCGRLSGLEHLRKKCEGCGSVLVADPYGEGSVICYSCGRSNDARGDVCDICGTTVGMKLKYDVAECQERGMTYAVREGHHGLVVWNKDPRRCEDHPDIKEQEVYFGDIRSWAITDLHHHGTSVMSRVARSLRVLTRKRRSCPPRRIIVYAAVGGVEYDSKNLLDVRIGPQEEVPAAVLARLAAQCAEIMKRYTR